MIKGLGRGGAEMLLVDGPSSSEPSEFEYGFGYFVPWKNALVPDIEARFGKVACFDAAGGGAMLRRTLRVARHLKSWNADIVHCHLPLASVVGRFAGAISGVPVVSSEHNLYERYHPATRYASLATWGLQRGVIAVSDEVASSIARHAGDRVPVRVIRNGVSIGRFRRDAYDREAVRSKLGVSPDALLVGTVAVFRVQKRLDLWLEAAKRIRASRKDVEFVIVGDGPLKAEVEHGIRAAGLEGTVRLTGLLEDVRPMLAAMDAYMISSDFEGLPIALLEAMAMELVPVATRVGGIPEVLAPLGRDLLVARGDAAALADAVLSAASLPVERRRARGLEVRNRVATAFSTERMMRETEAVYREVLGGG